MSGEPRSSRVVLRGSSNIDSNQIQLGFAAGALMKSSLPQGRSAYFFPIQVDANDHARVGDIVERISLQH